MQAKVRLKALLFDMDGVLVDVSRSYRRAIEETVLHFTGRQIVPGTIRRYRYLGGFDDDWKLTRAIITDSGMEVSPGRVIDEFQRRYRGERWDGFIAEEPPLVQTRTLERLQADGRILGIVTGRPEAEVKWTIERFGWKRYFPLIVAREKTEQRGKPDPFPLQHALSVLGIAGRQVETEEAVYIGDTVDDMAAARAAGLWAVGTVPPDADRAEHERHLRDRGAHLILDDLDTLPDLVDSFGERLALAAATNEQEKTA